MLRQPWSLFNALFNLYLPSLQLPVKQCIGDPNNLQSLAQYRAVHGHAIPTVGLATRKQVSYGTVVQATSHPTYKRQTGAHSRGGRGLLVTAQSAR